MKDDFIKKLERQALIFGWLKIISATAFISLLIIIGVDLLN